MSTSRTRAAALCALALMTFGGSAVAGETGAAPTPPASGAAQALPPKYLSIPDFKACLSTKSEGTYQSWCRPRRKPGLCPADSWARLKALSGRDALPKCPRPR